MSLNRIKKNDTVMLIAGKDKGKTGYCGDGGKGKCDDKGWGMALLALQPQDPF